MEARLTSVVVYPFKGAAGIAVDAAEIRITGLATESVDDMPCMIAFCRMPALKCASCVVI